MSQNILVIPDKYKGTLTAHEAAEAIAEGWRSARPGDHVVCQPMSDGGDGFGKILSELLGAETKFVETVDAAHRPLQAEWWFEPASRTAIIESANIIGLALLPLRQFHPFELDTTGLAAALREANKNGATKCIIGIGGSSTNDGGFGMATGLGWTFLDANGQPIQSWTGLDRLEKISPPKDPVSFQTRVAVDVQNPLLGPRGASRVYGPQKGLEESNFGKAESCLKRLSEVVADQSGKNIANLPGAGAAGGLGFGLAAFLNGSLESGFDLFAKYAGLKEKIADSDLIITGEGSMDESTLMGKGVGEIIRLCEALGKPCIGLSGVLIERKQLETHLKFARSLAPDFCAPEEAMRHPAEHLRRLARATAKEWNSAISNE